MSMKHRYRLIEHIIDKGFLIEDRKLEIETPYFEDLYDFLNIVFADKYSGNWEGIRTSLIEFESLESFKEEYPEYFI